MADDETTAVQLVKDAFFLRQNGERPPGAPHGNPEAETWREWERRAEVFLRGADRRRVQGRLWAARCELDPEVMQAMDDEALTDHLHVAHADGLID